MSSGTSLTANFVIDPTAADGLRTVTVTTADRDQRTADLHDHPAGTRCADADQRHAESRHPGATVAVTLTGADFVVGATRSRQR